MGMRVAAGTEHPNGGSGGEDGSGAPGPGISAVTISIAVGVVALACVLPGLARADIWHDEAASIYFARLPLLDLPGELARRDNHGPGYFAFLHVWTAVFGDGALAARVPSALAAAATVILTALIGCRVHGARAGLAAGLLLATSPLHAWYGQEVRFYAPALALGAGQVLAALRVLETPTRGRQVTLALVAALGFVTFYLVGLISLAIGASVVLAKREDGDRQARRAVLVALACAGVLLLAWAPGLQRQSEHALRYLSWIKDSPVHLFLAGALRDVAGGHHVPHGLPTVAGGLLAALSGVFVVRAVTARSVQDLLIVLWLVIPIAAVLVLSLKQSFLVVRYLLVALPALYLAAVGGVMAARRGRALQLGAVALLILVAGVQASGLVGYHAGRKRAVPWREAARYVRSELRAGDAVAIAPHWDHYSLEYHFGEVEPRLALRADEDPIAAIPAGVSRLWVLQVFDEGAPVRERLAEGLTVLKRRSFGSLYLDLLEVPAAADPR